MSLSTLTDLLSGTAWVRIDLRTAHGLDPVASGRLAGADRTGHILRLEDEITGRTIAVTLTSAHVVAYTPGSA